LFYAADFHGADVCFKKFLNAAKHFGARTLVAGGDLTGKVMIPVIETSNGWLMSRMGEEVVYRTEEAVGAAEKELRDRGSYPFRTDMAEIEHLRGNPEAQSVLRDRLVRDQLQRWYELTEERLAGAELLLIPGNDDAWIVDDYLRQWENYNIDGRSVEVRGVTFIGVGVSNETPFKSAREFSESQIASLIDTAAEHAEGPLIFNIHVPPKGTKLDICPRLDEDLRPVIRNGTMEQIHAGSQAVREAIDRLQPTLSLHGHIHESPGFQLMGNTVAVNPGSEYGSGVLRGLLATIEGGVLKQYQLTSG